jgi:hypothetical protein
VTAVKMGHTSIILFFSYIKIFSSKKNTKKIKFGTLLFEIIGICKEFAIKTNVQVFAEAEIGKSLT